MNITISKSELARALSITQSIVERRSTMPILANVLLSAGDQKLKVSATDFEITAVVSAAAEIASPGSITVNAKIFGDIVRELPEGDVGLKVTEGERLEINAGKSRLRVIGVSAEEFPALPGIGLEIKGRISSALFSEMINKTFYSVSIDETRFNLNGVCFEVVSAGKGKKTTKSLRMVATDGHRLAMITRPVTDLELPQRVIVPRKGLGELKKILGEDGDSEVGIEFRDGFLLMEKGSCKVSVRLIDGEFPDYNQVLPPNPGVVAVMQSDKLEQALRRVSLLVTDKGKCVKLDFKENSLRISSSSPELGDASDELDITYAGQPLSVGFNSRYVLEFLASLGEQRQISLELNGELGPGKLSCPDDDSYVGIVMPMRLT